MEEEKKRMTRIETECKGGHGSICSPFCPLPAPLFEKKTRKEKEREFPKTKEEKPLATESLRRSCP